MIPEKIGNKENSNRDILGTPWKGQVDKISQENWEWRGGPKKRGEGKWGNTIFML